MATPGQLIDCFADALCLPRSLVEANYRSLREMGLVTRGGRGRSAPTSTTKDAATLLIALLTRETATSAGASFREFGPLPFLVLLDMDDEQIAVDMSAFDEPNTFADGIAILFAELPRLTAELDRGDKDTTRRISVETDMTNFQARISAGGVFVCYESINTRNVPGHAMLTRRIVSERSLVMIHDRLKK